MSWSTTTGRWPSSTANAAATCSDSSTSVIRPARPRVTTQLLVADWHDALGDPTLANVILDRLVHHAHALNLAGESLRKLKPKLTEELTAA